MLNADQVQELLEACGAILRGHFSLTSGAHSPVYVQSSLIVGDPVLGQRLARAVSSGPWRSGTTCVLGSVLGGIILAYEVARTLGVRAVYAERLQGVLHLARGFDLTAADRVLVVDDVVITGGTIHELLQLVSSRGAEVTGVGVLVDRAEGPLEFGVPYHVLAKLQVPSWSPDVCPLCRQGRPLTRPRHGRL
ncbi:MAG TPA: orotate phosphoribosyltransferase [Clostridiales bacterium UBA8153]|nr:orotate phosphoribosyltransferase [Clostridiales bacterium UBA8153]